MNQMAGIGRVILIVAIAFGCGFAQQAAPDKRARDIEKEQPRKVITASPLCQRTMAHPETESMHDHPIDRSTLAPSLTALMERSDDVILTSTSSKSAEAIAPSGDDVIEYQDVKVLRTWKGLFKPGDTVTFAFPWSSVQCSLAPVESGGPTVYTTTGAGYWQWSGAPEAYVLFLRRAQGVETLLTPGLRMTGGSGMQGMYPVQFPASSPLIKESHCQNDLSRDKYPEDPKLCLEFLENSDLPISIPLSIDPLFKNYNEMRVSEFLREIQDTADSLGGDGATQEPK